MNEKERMIMKCGIIDMNQICQRQTVLYVEVLINLRKG